MNNSALRFSAATWGFVGWIVVCLGFVGMVTTVKMQDNRMWKKAIAQKDITPEDQRVLISHAKSNRWVADGLMVWSAFMVMVLRKEKRAGLLSCVIFTLLVLWNLLFISK